MRELQQAADEILDQLLTLIVLVPSNVYSVSPSQFNERASSQSSIGKHVRHILDHFFALKNGVDEACINYTLRQRQSLLEDDPNYAHQCVLQLKQWFKDTELKDTHVQVINEVSTSSTQTVHLSSFLSRELAFVIHHTHHHIAFANLLAQTFDVFLPDDLGVAPETATYLRSLSASVSLNHVYCFVIQTPRIPTVDNESG